MLIRITVQNRPLKTKNIHITTSTKSDGSQAFSTSLQLNCLGTFFSRSNIQPSKRENNQVIIK